MTAEEIKNIRRGLGLSQPEFGRRLKVASITISRWERGIQKPKPALLRKLNRLVGVG